MSVIVRRMITGAAITVAAAANALAQAPQLDSDQVLQEANRRTAEAFIDAFYSFDPGQLAPLLEYADESATSILNYQGWAEGGNYKVLQRAACEAESSFRFQCAVTVQDDPVLALQTGFNVTDTFHLTFSGRNIESIQTSSNDQPIYYEARQWVEENMPEVMAGPCAESAGTPAACARAMTEGYKAFYEATRGDRSGEQSG